MKLSKVIHLRLSQEEKEHLEEQARRAGVPVSRLLRDTLTGIDITPAADLETLQLLRKLGGLCKYAIREGAPREEADKAFRALANYAASLVR